MSSNCEVKGLYRRLGHLVKYSNRTIGGAHILGVACICLYFELWMLQRRIWDLLGDPAAGFGLDWAVNDWDSRFRISLPES